MTNQQNISDIGPILTAIQNIESKNESFANKLNEMDDKLNVLLKNLNINGLDTNDIYIR